MSEPKSRVVLRWPEVERRVRRSRAQVWRDIRTGRFPAPVQLGPNAIGWFEDEIEAHQAKLQRVNYAPAPLAAPEPAAA